MNFAESLTESLCCATAVSYTDRVVTTTGGNVTTAMSTIVTSSMIHDIVSSWYLLSNNVQYYNFTALG